MEKESLPRRIYKGFQFFVRYLVGSILLFYAVPKLLGVQFQVMNFVYDTPLGKISDFHMAWAFFAHSYYYQLLIGLAEVTIAFLLFFRRTKTLGILCALPIVANVLMVDYFFKVSNAMPVAIVLIIGVIYLLVSEFPKLKTFFWDEQKGASSNHTLVGSFIYGLIIFSLSFGLLTYLIRSYPKTLEGAYKIEKYSVNGTPLALSAGEYGKDPMMYFEFNNVAVSSVDGKNTGGSYSFTREPKEFTLTSDSKNPDAVLKGTYQINGDDMTLQGKRGTDDVEIMLKRVSRETR